MVRERSQKQKNTYDIVPVINNKNKQCVKSQESDYS